MLGWTRKGKPKLERAEHAARTLTTGEGRRPKPVEAAGDLIERV